MKEHRYQITDVLALLTLTVFALCVLLVLLTGASVYRDLVSREEASYTRRTALQYLTTRVRQAESVKAGDFDGCQALILEDTIDGETYTTRVYCHDGWLRELYSVAGAKLSPENGEALLEADSLTVSLDDRLLTVTLAEDRLQLYLPAGTEVAP